MSKAAKPGAEAAVNAPPAKSRKKLIIIAIIILLIGGGAAAFFLMKPAPQPAKPGNADMAAEEAHSENPPVYVPLGTFTGNLAQEEADQHLQVTIVLKITRPELADKIKAANPEILHHINMLLQSKRPSEINTIDGKQRLARQIKTQVEYVIGLRKTPPIITNSDAIPDNEHASNEKSDGKSGIADVLFTSFLIQ